MHVICIELLPEIFHLNVSGTSQISSECMMFEKAVVLGYVNDVSVVKSNKK